MVMMPAPATQSPRPSWLRQAWRRWCMSLPRRRCKRGEHKPQVILIRRDGSRFYVQLRTCRRCHQILEAEGRHAFRV